MGQLLRNILQNGPDLDHVLRILFGQLLDVIFDQGVNPLLDIDGADDRLAHLSLGVQYVKQGIFQYFDHLIIFVICYANVKKDRFQRVALTENVFRFFRDLKWFICIVLIVVKVFSLSRDMACLLFFHWLM